MTLTERKDSLCESLGTAITLELTTIPPYLTALLSIKNESNRAAANAIREVMMEEMLHMVMVGNLISSLGRKVRLGEKNLPQYPVRLEFKGQHFRDRDFPVNLAPFSRETLETFLKIEKPASLLQGQPRTLGVNEIHFDQITIGEFYRHLITELTSMCHDFPECEVFSGDTKKQIGEQYYWSGAGTPVVITSLETAISALTTVIDQGEGTSDSIESSNQALGDVTSLAHYYRFNQIYKERCYKPTDKPHDEPSGDPMSVDYSQVYPIKSNARQADYACGSKLATLNESFNRHYSLMIVEIETAFNSDASVMYDAINSGMRVMTPIAREMMETPIPGDSHSRSGAPSFEWVQPEGYTQVDNQ